jgi:hypothetical protein
VPGDRFNWENDVPTTFIESGYAEHLIIFFFSRPGGRGSGGGLDTFQAW